MSSTATSMQGRSLELLGLRTPGGVPYSSRWSKRCVDHRKFSGASSTPEGVAELPVRLQHKKIGMLGRTYCHRNDFCSANILSPSQSVARQLITLPSFV